MLADLAMRDGQPSGRVRSVRRPRPATRARARRGAAGREPDRARRRRGGGAGGRRRLRRELREPPGARRAAGRAARAAGQRAADAARRARPAAARRGAARRRPPVPADVRRGARDRSGRWLRKPLRGGGGTRVREWRGGALPAGTFVQERIDGVACSAAAVGDGVDAVVLGLTEQLVGRRAFGVRGYRWCGNVVPPRLPAGERDALLEQARAICSCLAARVRVARAVRRRLRLGRRARVDDRGQPASDRVARGDRGGVRRRRVRRAPAGVRRRAAARRGRARAARPARRSSSPPRTWSSATACAGWSAACATSRTPASASPRGVRSARSWRPPRRREDALGALEEQAARLRAELEPRVEVAAGG